MRNKSVLIMNADSAVFQLPKLFVGDVSVIFKPVTDDKLCTRDKESLSFVRTWRLAPLFEKIDAKLETSLLTFSESSLHLTEG